MTPRPDYRGFYRWMMEQLRSDEYPCPGGHGSEPNSGERHEHERYENWKYETEHEWDPREGCCALCGKETLDGFPGQQFRFPLADGPPPPDGYRLPGECPGEVTILTESDWSEYDGRSYVYPTPEGPCAEALGLEDAFGDGRDDDPMLVRWAERGHLLHKAEEAAWRQFHIRS